MDNKTINSLTKQEIDQIIVSLMVSGKLTIEHVSELKEEVDKRNKMIRTYKLSPLKELKDKFGIKKLSKLTVLVPNKAYTYGDFLIPEIYRDEIISAVGEHYIPEKRKNLENDILDQLWYLNNFIKQTDLPWLGRYRKHDYKYLIYKFKHKFLNEYIKNNPSLCDLELQRNTENQEFLSVSIQNGRYKFHLPLSSIIYRRKIKFSGEAKEYKRLISGELESKGDKYFNKMYILMNYYLNFVLI